MAQEEEAKQRTGEAAASTRETAAGAASRTKETVVSVAEAAKETAETIAQRTKEVRVVRRCLACPAQMHAMALSMP